MRELEPGDPKYDEVDVALTDVRRPTPVKAESSDGLKAIPEIDAALGFAFIREIYFSASRLAHLETSCREHQLRTLELFM